MIFIEDCIPLWKMMRDWKKHSNW